MTPGFTACNLSYISSWRTENAHMLLKMGFDLYYDPLIALQKGLFAHELLGNVEGGKSTRRSSPVEWNPRHLLMNAMLTNGKRKLRDVCRVRRRTYAR